MVKSEVGEYVEEAAAYAKNEVVRELQENGQIGYESETPEPMIAELAVDISGSYTNVQRLFTADSPMAAVGNSNRVIWDGVAYTCETKDIYFSNGTSARGIGNASFNSHVEADTGEPFYIEWNPSSVRVVSIFGEPGTHTLEIQNLVKVTAPISDKYLPGVCLPVVQMPDSFNLLGATTGGYQLTAEDCAILDAAAQARMPIVLRFLMDGAPSAYLFHFTADRTSGECAFLFGTGQTNIVISGQGNSWQVMLM